MCLIFLFISTNIVRIKPVMELQTDPWLSISYASDVYVSAHSDMDMHKERLGFQASPHWLIYYWKTVIWPKHSSNNTGSKSHLPLFPRNNAVLKFSSISMIEGRVNFWRGNSQISLKAGIEAFSRGIQTPRHL